MLRLASWGVVSIIWVMSPVIDSHCHIFPGDFSERRSELLRGTPPSPNCFQGGRAALATAETLVEAMDRHGVDRAVAMGVGWNDIALAREANDYLMEAAAAFPERVSGLCSVNPCWGDAGLDEIERCAKGGLIGIGELHPTPRDLPLTTRTPWSR